MQPAQDVTQSATGLMPIESRVNEYIRNTEVLKANVLEIQGNPPNSPEIILPNQFMRTAIMDEDYLIVSAHVDKNLECRIHNGDYIDFARLLPCDRVQMQLDNHVELVNHNSHLTCAPINDSPAGTITSFAQWEQVFRVFSNIYTRQFPQRAAELIQYNHVIHTAAMSFAWNNVYAYDIDFRYGKTPTEILECHFATDLESQVKGQK